MGDFFFSFTSKSRYNTSIVKNLLHDSYRSLLKTHGDPTVLWPQWCARGKDENLRQLVVLGAILTQRTSWRNADLALRNLKREELLSLKLLADISNPSSLAPYTHPAGFHQTKPKRLIEFSKFVVNTYGSLENMRDQPITKLRNELLEVYGIGPETADTILLYALDQPSFVIDAYTRRLLQKNEFPEHDIPYADLKSLFEKSLPQDLEIYQNYHILIIADQKGSEASKMEIVEV